MGDFCLLLISLYIFQILYSENVAFEKSQSPKVIIYNKSKNNDADGRLSKSMVLT